jgi:hypothetical protein
MQEMVRDFYELTFVQPVRNKSTFSAIVADRNGKPIDPVAVGALLKVEDNTVWDPTKGRDELPVDTTDSPNTFASSGMVKVTEGEFTVRLRPERRQYRPVRSIKVYWAFRPYFSNQYVWALKPEFDEEQVRLALDVGHFMPLPDDPTKLALLFPPTTNEDITPPPPGTKYPDDEEAFTLPERAIKVLLPVDALSSSANTPLPILVGTFAPEGERPPVVVFAPQVAGFYLFVRRPRNEPLDLSDQGRFGGAQRLTGAGFDVSDPCMRLKQGDRIGLTRDEAGQIVFRRIWWDGVLDKIWSPLFKQHEDGANAGVAGEYSIDIVLILRRPTFAEWPRR